VVGQSHGLKALQWDNFQIACIQGGRISIRQCGDIGTLGKNDSFGFGIGLFQASANGAEKNAKTR
jgi:hypothetical protein